MKSFYKIVFVAVLIVAIQALCLAEPAGDNAVTKAVDEIIMPTPDGGMAALAKQIKYPDAARKEGITGTVYVSAVIAKDGTVTKTTIEKGVNNELDAAAVEAITATKWIPAKKAGEAVEVSVTIPISFKLDCKDKVK
ncbi:MAG: energy transducer TonB [bacterium]|nr:energy transducer TonB [bacterium]